MGLAALNRNVVVKSGTINFACAHIE
jgi:hypothetical protein